MHRPLRILVAPCGFKESLGPEDVASCIEAGVKRAVGDIPAFVRKVPVHDGGEGFCKSFVAHHSGKMYELEVTGPIGKPVMAHYGIVNMNDNSKTAVLDMASAAGLRLVPKDHRNPTLTTTYGVGQLMSAALDNGCQRIIIGCGDSGTSDGGAGMLQALGAQLFDSKGNELPLAAGGASLADLKNISLANIHHRLRTSTKGKLGCCRTCCNVFPLANGTIDDQVTIEAVCNIKNILCGERGVARVYGPQKGATPNQVETLSKAMDSLAKAAKSILGKDISTAPGAGASGGLGAGLMLLNTTLRPRAAAIDDYFQLQEEFKHQWDMVFTAEGSLDWQSAKGKMTVEIAKRARASGCPQVIALAGTIRDGAESVYAEGIAAFTSIIDSPLSLEDAIEQTPMLLTNSAERTMRMLLVGLSMRFQPEKTMFPSISLSRIDAQPAKVDMGASPVAA